MDLTTLIDTNIGIATIVFAVLTIIAIGAMIFGQRRPGVIFLTLTFAVCAIVCLLLASDVLTITFDSNMWNQSPVTT